MSEVPPLTGGEARRIAELLPPVAVCPACGHRMDRPSSRPPGERGRIGGSNRMLTMREAAEYVGISYYRFARHYREWRIPFHRVGGRCNFRERELEAFLDRVREGS